MDGDDGQSTDLGTTNSCGTTNEKITQNWRVVGTSVQGGSHSKLGVSCQDSHQFELLSGEDTETLFIAIADGAGSAKYGEIGARHAVATAIATAKRREDDILSVGITDEELQQFLVDCFHEVRSALEQEATSRGETPRDIATTLILVVAQRGFVAAGQIGDGACVVEFGDNDVAAISGPKIGEYINETVFVTSIDALDELQFDVRRGEVRSIAAFCDGLQVLALKLPDGTPHNAFFAPLFNFVADSSASADQLQDFLSSPRIQERADDDLTLVLAHCFSR